MAKLDFNAHKQRLQLLDSTGAIPCVIAADKRHKKTDTEYAHNCPHPTLAFNATTNSTHNVCPFPKINHLDMYLRIDSFSVVQSSTDLCVQFSMTDVVCLSDTMKKIKENREEGI